jgi:hypothetical protein
MTLEQIIKALELDISSEVSGDEKTLFIEKEYLAECLGNMIDYYQNEVIEKLIDYAPKNLAKTHLDVYFKLVRDVLRLQRQGSNLGMFMPVEDEEFVADIAVYDKDMECWLISYSANSKKGINSLLIRMPEFVPKDIRVNTTSGTYKVKNTGVYCIAGEGNIEQKFKANVPTITKGEVLWILTELIRKRIELGIVYDGEIL